MSFVNNNDLYIIIAHDNPNIINDICNILNYKKNDILVIIDKKSKIKDDDILKLNGRVSFVRSYIDIKWGDISLCEVTINALKYNKIDYRYYHLLSGCDIPLYNGKELYLWFSKNYGYEFIDYSNCNFDERYKSFSFFQRYNSFRNSFWLKKFNRLLSISLKTNKKMNIKYGSNWFSITNGCANYIVENSKTYLNKFKYTLCSDEVFIQSILIGTEYEKNVFNNVKLNTNNNTRNNLRYIDWGRGSPYVFSISDMEELNEAKKKGFLFCRKVDKDIYIAMKERLL